MLDPTQPHRAASLPRSPPGPAVAERAAKRSPWWSPWRSPACGGLPRALKPRSPSARLVGLERRPSRPVPSHSAPRRPAEPRRTRRAGGRDSADHLSNNACAPSKGRGGAGRASCGLSVSSRTAPQLGPVVLPRASSAGWLARSTPLHEHGAPTYSRASSRASRQAGPPDARSRFPPRL